MAEDSKPPRRRRWLVLVLVVGAGAWVVRTWRATGAGTGPPERREARPTAPPVAISDEIQARLEPVTEVRPEPVAVARPEPVALTEPELVAEPEPFADASAEPEPAVGSVVDPEPVIDIVAEPERAAEPEPDPDPEPEPHRVAAVGGVEPDQDPGTGPAGRPTPRPRTRRSGQERALPPGAAAPLPDGSAPGAEYTVKGNAFSRFVHSPSSPYYPRTRAEFWFRSVEEAREAGFTEWTPRKRVPG